MPDAKTQFVAERIFASKRWQIAFDTLPELTKREFLNYAEGAIKAMADWDVIRAAA